MYLELISPYSTSLNFNHWIIFLGSKLIVFKVCATPWKSIIKISVPPNSECMGSTYVINGNENIVGLILLLNIFLIKFTKHVATQKMLAFWFFNLIKCHSDFTCTKMLLFSFLPFSRLATLTTGFPPPPPQTPLPRHCCLLILLLARNF